LTPVSVAQHDEPGSRIFKDFSVKFKDFQGLVATPVQGRRQRMQRRSFAADSGLIMLRLLATGVVCMRFTLNRVTHITTKFRITSTEPFVGGDNHVRSTNCL